MVVVVVVVVVVIVVFVVVALSSGLMVWMADEEKMSGYGRDSEPYILVSS